MPKRNTWITPKGEKLYKVDVPLWIPVDMVEFLKENLEITTAKSISILLREIQAKIECGLAEMALVANRESENAYFKDFELSELDQRLLSPTVTFKRNGETVDIGNSRVIRER